MKTNELMSSRVISIHPDEPVSAAARQLRRNNIGALPVCDDSGRLRGMITDRDIVVRCIAADMDPGDTRIREIMSRGVVSVSPNDPVESAARKMAGHQVRRLPVVEGQRLVGILSLCDLARRSGCDMEAAEALSEISSNFRRP